MRIRILYVTINLEIGGTEKQLVELVNGLDRSRFEPHVCCIRGGGSLIKELERKPTPLTLFKFPSLENLNNIRKARVFLAQVFALYKTMRQLEPVIVHALLPVACVTAGFAAKLAAVPLLITNRRSLGYYKERSFFLRRMERLVNLWTDAVVPNSEAVRRDTIARERIDKCKIRVIYNGVRIPAVRRDFGWRQLIGREINDPVVCLLANFWPYKGHRDFVVAAAAVLKKIPAVKFVLVGDGELRPEIERKAMELGLAENMIFLGFRSDGSEILNRADIAVLASHEEGFSNVVLEAMAAGKPVVATRVGGVPEAVEEGRTGLLVSPRAPEKLAEAIIYLLRDRGTAEEMGKRGSEVVRRGFAIERMVRSYEELYNDLLREKGIKRFRD